MHVWGLDHEPRKQKPIWKILKGVQLAVWRGTTGCRYQQPVHVSRLRLVVTDLDADV